jgi:hypothetical protein
MARYGRDDGSTVTGIIFAVAIVFSFTAGYQVRDKGFKLNVQQGSILNPTPQEVQAK